jgi:valyl-tRNA synthetase
MIPPPNVTGNLHVGHALTMTLQDTIIRWKRMQGKDTLWMPGTDHAGIATQMMVERQLQKEGVTRHELGRQEFINRVWEWKAESGGNITKQLRRLGASLDWSRERFTLDEKFSSAVNNAFILLYNEGLIYRDKRLVNWDPKLQSAVSDLEVKNKETEGHLWYIRYPISSIADTFITVATTRPETMLGDSAIAVHPTDMRYSHLIGKSAIVPLTGRIIPIISDEHSDPEKGTGAVKITPAHDFNDFAVGLRHNLPMPTIFDEQSNIILEEVKSEFQEVFSISDLSFVQSLANKNSIDARKNIIDKLEALNLLEKAEPHLYQVPYAERGGAIIEPRLTTQWFCNAAELAKPAIKAVEEGEMVFVPKQWENTFFSWMANIQPWCISRQLWWGHRIPAWYGPDEKIFVYHTEKEALEAAKKYYGKEDIHLTQDEDVLDTWFSSSLWPFATLGWPETTKDLERYYPNNSLITGFDIIFFWVSRMLMMGLHFTKQVPFRTVFIHGLVLDEHGQKMSKTKGNVVDPIDIMDQYGADILRWSVCSLTGPGRNLKLSPTRIETSRSFITKIRNAIIFCERNKVKLDPTFDSKTVKNTLCCWILAELNATIHAVDIALENFRFDEYTDHLYRFIWHTFCDWFIELAKPAFESPDADEVRSTAAIVLETILKLLHPVLPFTTEELWCELGFGPVGSLIHTQWPQAFSITQHEEKVEEVSWIIRLITSLRGIRAEMNIPYTIRIPVLFRDAEPKNFERARRWSCYIQQLARASEISLLTGDTPKSAAQIVIDEATVVIPLDNIIDIDAERSRLEKEIVKIETNFQRLSLQLENRDFIDKAPEYVIKERKQQIAKLQDEITKLKEALNRIKA